MFVPGSPRWGIEQGVGKADLYEQDGTAWYIEKQFKETKEGEGPHLLRVRYENDEVKDAVVFQSTVKQRGVTTEQVKAAERGADKTNR